MSDVTPSTFDIKWRYEAYREQEHQRGRTGVTPVSPGELGRWHAAEIRKARSDALREAAEDIDVSTYYRTPYKAEQHEIAAAYRAALLDRADRIEEDQ